MGIFEAIKKIEEKGGETKYLKNDISLRDYALLTTTVNEFDSISNMEESITDTLEKYCDNIGNSDVYPVEMLEKADESEFEIFANDKFVRIGNKYIVKIDDTSALDRFFEFNNSQKGIHRNLANEIQNYYDEMDEFNLCEKEKLSFMEIMTMLKNGDMSLLDSFSRFNSEVSRYKEEAPDTSRFEETKNKINVVLSQHYKTIGEINPIADRFCKECIGVDVNYDELNNEMLKSLFFEVKLLNERISILEKNMDAAIEKYSGHILENVWQMLDERKIGHTNEQKVEQQEQTYGDLMPNQQPQVEYQEIQQNISEFPQKWPKVLGSGMMFNEWLKKQPNIDIEIKKIFDSQLAGVMEYVTTLPNVNIIYNEQNNLGINSAEGQKYFAAETKSMAAFLIEITKFCKGSPMYEGQVKKAYEAVKNVERQIKSRNKQAFKSLR